MKKTEISPPRRIIFFPCNPLVTSISDRNDPFSYFQSVLSCLWISAQTFTWHTTSFICSTFKEKSWYQRKRTDIISQLLFQCDHFKPGQHRQLRVQCCMDNVPGVNLDLCLLFFVFFKHTLMSHYRTSHLVRQLYFSGMPYCLVEVVPFVLITKQTTRWSWCVLMHSSEWVNLYLK